MKTAPVTSLLFPAAVRDGTVRLAVWGGKVAGFDYYRLLDAECLVYSALLLAVPPALLLRTRSRGRSEAAVE